MASSKIIPKKSVILGAVPPSGSLLSGEIAINHTDKKLFAKNPSTGVIQEIGGMYVHSHDELYSVNSSQHLELQNNGTLVVTSGATSKTLTLPSASGTIATLDDITGSVAGVASVNTRTGAVILDKADVGLANCDNTSDANKPVSTDTQTALNGKANAAHQHALSDLTQSSATTGQVVAWDGTTWAPSTPDGGVASVNTRTGEVTLTKSDVGLANCDNTSDVDKPISTATQTALNGKVGSNITGVTGATALTNMMQVTLAGYNALGASVNTNTIYIIVG